MASDLKEEGCLRATAMAAVCALVWRCMFGDVLFGNIGSGNRLDFTCIGPAVNLAARLEKLAGRLGRTILASEDFVDHCGDDGLQPIGRFAVAGFSAEQMVYGLADEVKGAP